MLCRRLWRWPTFRVAPNTTRWPNTGLMLAQHHRRWANINPASRVCPPALWKLWQKWMEQNAHTERTEVKQHVPTSLWVGRHNNITRVNRFFNIHTWIVTETERLRAELNIALRRKAIFFLSARSSVKFTDDLADKKKKQKDFFHF